MDSKEFFYKEKDIKSFIKDICFEHHAPDEHVDGVPVEHISQELEFNMQFLIKASPIDVLRRIEVVIENIKDYMHIKKRFSGKFTMMEGYRALYGDAVTIVIKFEGQNLDKHFHEKEFSDKFLEEINE